MSDNKLVYIKRVKTGGSEERIATLFSTERLRADSRNHAVPILDVFPDDEQSAVSYIVMPFLRLMDQPQFTHVNDIVEFMDQMLEVCLHDVTSCIADMRLAGTSFHA